ncbi:MAG: MarR family transcriptional regulator, partial [Deltaproteobacteria bacterium]|nr:MarR family transcriptional regulator [Deltaproteobacteria bacterium]
EPPRIEADGDWFSITFRRKGAHDAIERPPARKAGPATSERGDAGGVNGGVNEGVNGLLEFIRNTPGLRTPQISRAMGIPVTTLEHWLNQLKSKGCIEFVGSPRSGGYRKKEIRDEGIFKGVSGGVNGGVSGGVTEGIEDLLKYVRNNPGQRAPEISRANKIPVRTAERCLRQLRERGAIEFRGSPKTGGYWARRPDR